MNQVIVIARMNHTLDKTFESENRIYSAEGISNTLQAESGGGGRLLIGIYQDKSEQRTRIL